jgi:deoxyribodipyrimidine photo-lyase
LSPHLRFGEISARQIWHAVQHYRGHSGPAEKFLAELGWREFSAHLLYHHPDLPDRPLRPEFEHFPWQPDDELLRAWQQGRTGYGIVDAGMRQLWQTGWMHNRVRMIAASFLTKHLLQPWQDGAAWFLDTLVDADLASNSQNWQWVAGCGADAAPYFRIFNPSLQASKFDPNGDYIRRYVPERASEDTEALFQPKDPIVEHGTARRRALDALAEMRRLASI